MKKIIAAAVAAVAMMAAAPAAAHADAGSPKGGWASPIRVAKGHPKAGWISPIRRAPAAQAPRVYVVVRPGMTLWRIAVDVYGNGHKWPTIAKMNGLKGTTIYAGQVLRVR